MSQAESQSRQPIRVKSGCLSCRKRKKKCDEKKPICSGCLRNQLCCQWPPPESSQRTKVPKASRMRHRERQRNASVGSNSRVDHLNQSSEDFQTATSSRRQDDLSPSSADSDSANLSLETFRGPQRELAVVTDQSESEHEEGSPEALGTRTLVEIAASAPVEGIGCAVVQGAVVTALPISREVSILPRFDHSSFELLHYYLTKTAVSMGNGSTETNPFVAQLIPLAFAEPMLLKLILAQSAVHRAVVDQSLTIEVAQTHYSSSLRLFRKHVSDYLGGERDQILVLIVGSLIMCLTEVAKGDVHGTIFNHLDAARALLVELLSTPASHFPKDLRDFLVEYYMYTAALSMISVDVSHHKSPVIDSAIMQAAQALVDEHYIGHLCGCWLALLVLIPQIIELKVRISTSHGQPGVCSTDDAMTLIFLQNQILHYMPDMRCRPDVALTGYIFQHATMLYLLTTVDSPARNKNSMHNLFIENAAIQALSCLEQLPPTARINTSLLWPIAVVGSCISDHEVQSTLRTRLRIMLETIGLGNIPETENLLNHIWQEDVDTRGPWTIWKTMQEHQIWISFA